MSPDSLAAFEMAKVPEMSESSGHPVSDGGEDTITSVKKAIQPVTLNKVTAPSYIPRAVIKKLEGVSQGPLLWRRSHPRYLYRVILLVTTFLVCSVVWKRDAVRPVEKKPRRAISTFHPTCLVNLKSEPAGARVAQEGRLLTGRTPMVVTVPCGDQVALALHIPSYGTICKTVVANEKESDLIVTFHSFPLNLFDSAGSRCGK
jgi:hypothetical protein